MVRKKDGINTLGIGISYLRKSVNDQCLDLQKQKKMKKRFLSGWILLINGKMNMKTKENENPIRKSSLTSKGGKVQKKVL